MKIFAGPLGIMDLFDQDMGLLTPSSHVTHTFLTYTDKMNFFERWYNTAIIHYDWFLRQVIDYPLQNWVIRKNFAHFDSLPSVSELRKNISLTFVNAHRSITYPRPSMPGLIYIGGAHIKPPKPLPIDLQQFIDNAEDGVIYFSLGTVVKSSKMPKEKLNAFLGNIFFQVNKKNQKKLKIFDEFSDCFRKLKQKILWKYEDESIPNLPENVLIRKWLPQQDILANPNVVLFISHGGMFSNFEAIKHGVQLLMIPFTGDQHRNAFRVEIAGYGKSMDFRDVNEDSLDNAINEMLTNNKYLVKAKEISTIFNDNPIHPMDEFIWWVEYVIRFRGAKHLKSYATEMSIFTYLLLDVMLVNLVIILIITVSVYRLIKKCLTKRKNVLVEKKEQ